MENNRIKALLRRKKWKQEEEKEEEEEEEEVKRTRSLKQLEMKHLPT